VAIGLTASGRSPDMVRALKSARAGRLTTIGLTAPGEGISAPGRLSARRALVLNAPHPGSPPLPSARPGGRARETLDPSPDDGLLARPAASDLGFDPGQLGLGFQEPLLRFDKLLLDDVAGTIALGIHTVDAGS